MAKRHCTSRVFICIICRCPVVVVVAVVLCNPCHGSSLNVINNKVKPKKKAPRCRWAQVPCPGIICIGGDIAIGVVAVAIV